jgi:hypothetical protein
MATLNINNMSINQIAAILGVVIAMSTIIYSSVTFAQDAIGNIAKEKAAEVAKPLQEEQKTAQKLNVLMMQSVLQLNTRIVDTEIEHLKEKQKAERLSDYDKIKLQSLIQEKAKIEADKLKVLELDKQVNKDN